MARLKRLVLVVDENAVNQVLKNADCDCGAFAAED